MAPSTQPPKARAKTRRVLVNARLADAPRLGDPTRFGRASGTIIIGRDLTPEMDDGLVNFSRSGIVAS